MPTKIGDNNSNQLIRHDDTQQPYDNTWTVIGLGGNDFLNGGIMKGGAGDDTYHVDSASDVVNEESNNDPYDTVYSYISQHTLAAGIENLILVGPSNYWAELGPAYAYNGKGNGLDNEIRGNELDNEIKGEGGHDTLWGGRGNDDLFGGSGHDRLIAFGDSGNRTAGRGEVDELTGNSGSDTFVLWGTFNNQKYAAYNDGKMSSFINGVPQSGLGLTDYALIKDFNKYEDVIELAGNASNYTLTEVKASWGVGSGTAIRMNNDLFGGPSEVIAVIENMSVNQLSLNGIGFSYV